MVSLFSHLFMGTWIEIFTTKCNSYPNTFSSKLRSFFEGQVAEVIYKRLWQINSFGGHWSAEEPGLHFSSSKESFILRSGLMLPEVSFLWFSWCYYILPVVHPQFAFLDITISSHLKGSSWKRWGRLKWCGKVGDSQYTSLVGSHYSSKTTS